MIIGNIIGGLGNQMFQYAAARSLATARKQPLYLDLSDFSGYRLHQGFELAKVFSGTFEAADAQQLEQVLGWRARESLRRMFKRRQMALFRNEHFVVEPQFDYWPGFFNVPNDCYLVGYWQSERYFKPVAEKIRKEFAFKSAPAGHNEYVAGQIAGCNAVSLHVRRGDYASNARTRMVHGLLPLDYYRDAASRIAEQVPSPVFFVFSDELDWAREYLKLPFPCRFIGQNQGSESYKDMQLMSLCRHHIIANSSFSWWGAWLNPAADKIVVAPRRWFADEQDVSDLFPRGWVAL